MSSDSREIDVMTLVRASVRTRLGEFADVFLDAKIKIAQKLSDKISGENDIDKLMELRSKLNDVMFSKEDVEQMDAKIGAGLAMMEKHMTTVIKLQKQWKDAARASHQ